MIQELLVYLFSFLVLSGAIGVVFLVHPVHSVLSLIWAFFNSAALYILMGAEFIALSSLIVYIGAVAVLLIFVVMSFNKPDGSEFLTRIKKYRLWLFPLVSILVIEMFLLSFFKQTIPIRTEITFFSIRDIGLVFYTQYGLIIQLCAVILLVAMVSAVILTFQTRSNKNIKRQIVNDQVMRDPKEILKMHKVESRKGI
jgi:NADH-quinone oxidoreductase subunit J